MYRILWVAMAIVGWMAWSASAATVILSDSTLLSLSDVGGTAASTLDNVVDIAGDPGVQYDVTFAPQSGWTDIAIGKYNPTEVAIGDTWNLTMKNLDPLYPTYAVLYMQVDGWNYSQGTGTWLGANGGIGTVSIANPAASVVNALGIKLGTDSWTGRPGGSSVSVQVIPEPSAFVLLACCGIFLLIVKRITGVH